jgi:hypothetical protein
VKRLAVIGVLGALVAAGAGVGTSSARFTAHEEMTGTVSTASDWVAPAVTLTTPADDSYKTSTSVVVSGAAGNAAGDSTTVTLNVYSGSTATGTPVITRSVTRSGATWSTTLTGLSQATYTVQATQSDGSDNTATTSANTFTVDTVAPTRVSMSAVNGSGTVGHPDAGDAITFTYSERMLPSSILPGWSGTSAATVKVRFYSGASVDSFTVLDSGSAANLRLEAGNATSSGGVTLGTTNYVTGTATFSATLTQSADGKSFVVTLTGAADVPSRIVSGSQSARTMIWTPKTGATDMAANGLASLATWTETDNDRDF